MQRENNAIRFTVLLSGSLLFGLMFLPAIHASECSVILEALKKERDSMKQRALMEQGVLLCPDHPIINYKYGFTLERLRKYSEALIFYMKAATLNPDFPKVYFSIGDIYMIQGNPKPAIEAYQKGLKLDPENSRAKKRLTIATVKYNAQLGKPITPNDFILVMREGKAKRSGKNTLDGPVLRMQILFELSSSQLTPAAIQTLNVVGSALKSPELSDMKFEIAGHTDNVGEPDSNLELSKLRASAVKFFLIQKFNIDKERLVIAFHGMSRPLYPNTTKQNRKINRRVEFRRLR